LKESLQKANLTLPNIGSLDIRADLLTAEGAVGRTTAYQQLPEGKKNKSQLIQFFRQFEKINNTEGITVDEIDRSLESFILSL
jgi:hypothetical protein